MGVLASVAAGGAAASAFSGTSRASAGATLTASDVTVRTDDGALSALTVAPAGTVSWSGLEEPAGSVRLSLHAKRGSAASHLLTTQRLSAAGIHGETDYAFDTRDLLDSEVLSTDDFDPADGERVTREVALEIAVEVVASDGETTLTTGDAAATFDATVVNRPEASGVEGQANTDGEAADDSTTTTDGDDATASGTSTTTGETSTATDETTTTETTTASTDENSR